MRCWLGGLGCRRGLNLAEEFVPLGICVFEDMARGACVAGWAHFLWLRCELRHVCGYGVEWAAAPERSLRGLAALRGDRRMWHVVAPERA